MINIIYECARNFKKMHAITYEFHVSKKRQIKKIRLNFKEKDFFHLAGFQYLKDLSIPRNRNITIDKILEKSITTEKLSKSKYYNANSTDEKDVESRISELRFLEQYLDSENIIKIFLTRNMPCTKSQIKAKYIIESYLKERKKTVYIFLNERKEDTEHYCVVSFFVKKNVAYGGDILYWMLKKKIVDGNAKIIYRNSGYVEEY